MAATSSKHDIGLGDVMAVSNNGKGGVVQYDFGKAIQVPRDGNLKPATTAAAEGTI